MKFKQIKETCIYFNDLGMAKDFYHYLLELPIINEMDGKHIFFRAGTSVLLCFNPDDSRFKTSPPPHFSDGKYHFALEVTPELYQQHKEEIIKKGIHIIDTLVWKNGQESFYFNDPIGNVIEIIPEGVWD
ncbi:MAG: VOC family protein [Cyclobacteriaceae bacterium]|nr:VOC family protein [Cyclobacteriaceae bacterium]